MRDVSADPVVSTSPTQNPDPSDEIDLLVLGGGISGLVLAWEVLNQRPQWRIQVLEAGEHPGGTVGSEWIEGCLCERGPNGFLTHAPHTQDLAVRLGLESRLIRAAPGVSRRFVWSRGALRRIPSGPAQFLTSDLLGFRAKLRALKEPLIRRRKNGQDMSVYEFVSRRVGSEMAAILADPMVLGIFGGDSRKISIQAAFPAIAAMETAHGSLTRAMIARRRKSGGKREKPVLTSFDQGMEVLIRELVRRLGPRVQTGTSAASLEQNAGSFQVSVAGNPEKKFAAKRVVVATPAHVARGLLQAGYPRLAARLGEIPYAGIAVANLIYDRSQISHPLNGFGFLVPPGQGLRIIGSIWTGNVFPEHVTGDRVVVRARIGGSFDPESPLLPQGKIINLVHADLARALGAIQGTPKAARVYRHPKGIPQYELGHLERVVAITKEVKEVPGLFLTGNAYTGVGINDCVRNSRALAKQIAGVEAVRDTANPISGGVT